MDLNNSEVVIITTVVIMIVFLFLSYKNSKKNIKTGPPRGTPKAPKRPIVTYEEQRIKLFYSNDYVSLEESINEFISDAGVKLEDAQYVRDYAIMITYTVSRYKVN